MEQSSTLQWEKKESFRPKLFWTTGAELWSSGQHARVERIVEDLKSGKKDHEDF